MATYKVNNLSNVDLRFYNDGDFFVTDRTIALLIDGELKKIQQDNRIRKELNELTKRVKSLEEGNNE